jgi:hypothetical protein
MDHGLDIPNIGGGTHWRVLSFDYNLKRSDTFRQLALFSSGLSHGMERINKGLLR